MLSKEEARILKDRIDMLNDEMNRIYKVIEMCENGVPFEEAYFENVYLELAELKRSAKAHVSIIVEHLLKLKYCTNNRNHNDWRITVREHKSEIIHLTKWKTQRSNTNIINEMNEELQYLYEDGCHYYELTSKIYKDIKEGIRYIPKECPWTLDELVENSIEDLLLQLPDPDELTVQMQLTPICKYLDVDTGKLADKIINIKCSECENYPQCISDYYEEV